MTPEAQKRFVLDVIAAHSDPSEAMAEGRPHRRAKSRALDELGLHFSKIGTRIYLADELAVVYPGEETFVPDLLAVLEVDQPQPDKDERMAWVVAEEGRGLDLVIEVMHRGDRDKDLVVNAERYARLGIQEYFVYDRLHLQVHGFRLQSPGARQYREVRPRLGRHSSQVLGLDLAVVDRQLRFFSGFSELIGSPELIERLSLMMEGIEGRAAEAEARADVEAERARTEAERARTEAERARTEAERAESLLGTVRQAIFLLLGARQVSVPDEVRAKVRACADPTALSRMLDRAATLTDALDLQKE